MRRRGGRLYKIEAEFEKENAVLIYMSNEIEEKPLPSFCNRMKERGVTTSQTT